MSKQNPAPAKDPIFRRRREPEHDGHHGGAWKIAYADFMTAMMAFFLVMWLINMKDEKTIVQVAQYFNPISMRDARLSLRGLSDGSNGGYEAERGSAALPNDDMRQAAQTPQRKANKAEAERELFEDPSETLDKSTRKFWSSTDASPSVAAASNAPADGASADDAAVVENTFAATAPEDAAVARIAQKLSAAKAMLGVGPKVSVRLTSEGILISLTDSNTFGMFEVSSAEPAPALVVLMQQVASTLASEAGKIVVRGDTDARQYKSSMYDNWRLSSARAHMAYYMLVNGGVPESRFDHVEGRADRDLLVKDNPRAAENRRIEILLKRQ